MAINMMFKNHVLEIGVRKRKLLASNNREKAADCKIFTRRELSSPCILDRCQEVCCHTYKDDTIESLVINKECSVMRHRL